MQRFKEIAAVILVLVTAFTGYLLVSLIVLSPFMALAWLFGVCS